MDIQEFIKCQKEFDKQYDCLKKWTEIINQNNVDVLEFLSIGLAGEVGETCNIVKKIVRGDCTIVDVKDHLTEELIDVFIYILKLLSQLEINVEEEYKKKLKANAKKFGRKE